MLTESALCLLLSREELPAETQQGGVITPATAFGNILINNLKMYGGMTFQIKQ